MQIINNILKERLTSKLNYKQSRYLLYIIKDFNGSFIYYHKKIFNLEKDIQFKNSPTSIRTFIKSLGYSRYVNYHLWYVYNKPKHYVYQPPDYIEDYKKYFLSYAEPAPYECDYELEPSDVYYIC